MIDDINLPDAEFAFDLATLCEFVRTFRGTVRAQQPADTLSKTGDGGHFVEQCPAPTEQHQSRRRSPRLIFPISGFQPVIGTEHSIPYAAQFAAWFLDWIREHDLISEWCVGELLVLAFHGFAVTAGKEMPKIRNLLGAIKRIPGVTVMADRHYWKFEGGYYGKTTVYDLRGTVGFEQTRPKPAPAAAPSGGLAETLRALHRSSADDR